MAAAESATPITAENYCLAESQVIMADYVKKIAAANGNDERGVGAFMHIRKGPDPKATLQRHRSRVYSELTSTSRSTGSHDHANQL